MKRIAFFIFLSTTVLTFSNTVEKPNQSKDHSKKFSCPYLKKVHEMKVSDKCPYSGKLDETKSQCPYIKKEEMKSSQGKCPYSDRSKKTETKFFKSKQMRTT